MPRRHLPDPLASELARARGAIFARERAGEHPHVVYALLARQGRGRRPIYVGETRNARRRFDTHLKTMFGGRDDDSARGQRLRALGVAGHRLEMEILEGVPHRLAALGCEAGWVRALAASGFDLANARAGHGLEPGGAVGAERVPLSRLRALPLSEAVVLELDLELRCRAGCGAQVLELPVRELAARISGSPPLGQIGGAVACAGCGGASLLEPVPDPGLLAALRVEAPPPERLAAFLDGIGLR